MPFLFHPLDRQEETGAGEGKNANSGQSASLSRVIINTLLVAAVISVLAAVIYQGFSGLKGRDKLRAEDLRDAIKPQYHPEDYGIVVEVYDGDTIRLEDGRRIRYLGIDTPETAKPWDPEGDPYAAEAAEFNREWVAGKEVGLVYGTQRQDRYGRTLAYVIVNDTCVNVELLRHGLGRAMIPDKYFKFRKWFMKAQDEAKEKGWGIWSQGN